MKGVHVIAITLILLFSGLVSASEYWVGFYGTPGHDALESVSIMPNGDIVAVGKVSFNGTTAPWAIRVDRYGEVLWSKYYPIPGAEGEFEALAVDEEGNIIAVGLLRKEAGSALTTDLLVMKLNGSGKVLWAKGYDAGSSEVGNSIVVGGNAIFVGGYTSIGDVPSVWILRLNPYGSVVWARAYSGLYPTFKPFLALNGSEILALGVLETGHPAVLRLNPLSGGIIDATEYTGLSTSSPIIAVGDGQYFLLNGNGTCLTVLQQGEEWTCYKPGFEGIDVSAAEYGAGVLYALSTAKPWSGINFYVLGLEGETVRLSRAYRLSDLDVPGSLAVSGDSLVVVGSTERFSSTVNTEGFIMRLPLNGAIKGYETKDVNPSVFTGSSSARKAEVSSESLLPRIYELEVEERDAPPVGFLRITTEGTEEPTMLYVDGKFWALFGGEGVFALAPGTHEVKLAAEGYYPYETTVSIEAGEETVIRAELERKIEYGTLVISSTPSSAAVYLNGTLVGWTPLTMNLTPGRYTLEVVKEGYEPYKGTIEVSANKETTIAVELEEVKTTTTSTVSTTTTTSAAPTTSSTQPLTTTSTSPQSESKTSTSKAGEVTSTTKKGGICGPGTVLLLPIISPLLVRRLRRGRR
ncbi:MAG: PEGA domain-containing protein [Thermococcus sp.]|nr:PEGA domain-containing protein [Thermococcus sp.]